MIALLMWGGWSAREEHSIVVIFGWSLGGFIAAMVAVIVGLLAGGPVGRFKMSASRDGASLEAGCIPPPPPAPPGPSPTPPPPSPLPPRWPGDGR
jgi:hypothetical protein